MRVSAADVRAAAVVAGLRLTEQECEQILPLVRANSDLGSALAAVPSTDALPTDDPRWFDHD